MTESNPFQSNLIYEEKITLCRIWTYDIGFWRPTFYRTELRALSYQNRKDCKEKDSFSNPNPFCMHIFYSFIKMNESVQFESISIDSSLLLKGAVIGRDDRIWTRDILYPKQTRYQAALHPFQLVYSIIVENPCLVFHIFTSSIDIQKFSFNFFFLVSYII